MFGMSCRVGYGYWAGSFGLWAVRASKKSARAISIASCKVCNPTPLHRIPESAPDSVHGHTKLIAAYQFSMTLSLSGIASLGLFSCCFAFKLLSLAVSDKKIAKVLQLVEQRASSSLIIDALLCFSFYILAASLKHDSSFAKLAPNVKPF